MRVRRRSDSEGASRGLLLERVERLIRKGLYLFFCTDENKIDISEAVCKIY